MNTISDENFDYILYLLYQGRSIRDISRIAKVAKQTAQKIYNSWWRNHKEFGGDRITPVGGYWAHKKHGRKRVRRAFKNYAFFIGQ